jgi:hypothetical protein
MPPALVRAWRLGHLSADRPFVWNNGTTAGRPRAADTAASALTRLARPAGDSGGAAALRRRPAR